MEKVELPDNHKRVIASSLYLIEKLVDELECELRGINQKIMVVAADSHLEENLEHYTVVVAEIKSYIRYISEKYSLNPLKQTLPQLINSRKTMIWEILSNTKTARMKGYGELPREYAAEVDNDISKLLVLSDKI